MDMSNERGIAGQATVTAHETGGVGSRFAGAHVAQSVPLAPLTTLRIGPIATRVITCTSAEQVVVTLRQLDADHVDPVLVLAGAPTWSSPTT
ncbi:UDP-N-acetylenolpyruvoylglucosamine reductase domain protein [Mycobacterium xenopi 3993]|nr:UDP-N-acetylenolpyruvoylglucosamine reductase domain protein [Mycobacterium xenopi 3993]